MTIFVHHFSDCERILEFDSLQDRFQFIDVERGKCFKDRLWFTLKRVFRADPGRTFNALNVKSTWPVDRVVIVDGEGTIARAIRAQSEDGLACGRWLTTVHVLKLIKVLGRWLIGALRLVDVSNIIIKHLSGLSLTLALHPLAELNLLVYILIRVMYLVRKFVGSVFNWA